MSYKEIDHLIIMEQVNNKQLSQIKVSITLKVTTSQVRRLLAKYHTQSAAGEQNIAEIHAIDPEIKIYKHSSGRIGCNKKEYLCMGETHNKAY